MEKMLSSGDVRKMLEVSYQRVHWLRITGRITGYRTSAGWLYDRESVVNYRRQRDAWRAKHLRRLVEQEGAGDEHDR